ncbi:MAG: hypothetical protein QNJ54_20055 [Prochloraceae cyanobacterium]|nr:hypothetical protein [Prochloraceae cyanobacterium]
MNNNLKEEVKTLINTNNKFVTNNNEDKVEKIKALIEELPLEKKASLIQDVLRSNGLQVVMSGTNFISAEVVLQIQSGSVDLEQVLKAAANRISKEFPDGNCKGPADGSDRQ